MPIIEWTSSYEVGVEEIDHEHQELVDLINDFHYTVAGGADREWALEHLGEIHARISGHFALEERLMRDEVYEDYHAHKADHERLLDQLLDMIEIYESQDSIDMDAFARVLHDWFSVHFTTHDAKLHGHL